MLRRAEKAGAVPPYLPKPLYDIYENPKFPLLFHNSYIEIEYKVKNVNTLTDQIGETPEDAREEKILIIDRELNEWVLEKAEQQKRKAIVSVSGIMNLTGIHERTIRSVGFPGVYETEFKSCEWKKWTGLVIEIKKYVKETGLLSEKEIDELYDQNHEDRG